jgi:hypothetical protein
VDFKSEGVVQEVHQRPRKCFSGIIFFLRIFQNILSDLKSTYNYGFCDTNFDLFKKKNVSEKGLSVVVLK